MRLAGFAAIVLALPASAQSQRAQRLLDEALLAQRSGASAEDLVDRFRAAADAEPAVLTRFDLAVALDRAGRAEEAEAAFREAAHGTGELAFLAAGRATSLAAERGDATAARSAAELAVQSLPSDVRPLVLRAELELRLRDPAAARKEARLALALASGDIPALCALARATLALGAPAAAHLFASRAAQAAPADARPLLVQAEIAREQGDASAELAAARAAVAADATSSPAQLAVGRALFERGDVPSALEAFEKAAQQDSASAQAHLALGAALFAQGRATEATKELTEAARLAPRAAEPHLELARLASDVGDARAALAEAKLYVQLARPAPEHPIFALVHHCQELLASGGAMRTWAFIAAALLVSAARAEEPKKPHRTVLHFGEDDIRGDLKRPDGELVQSPRKLAEPSLLRVRRNFVDRALAGAGRGR